MSLSHSSSTGLLLGSYRGQSTRSTQSATHEERLRTAASQGDLKMVAQMLHVGADGDAGDAYGVTPLMHACMSGSLPIVTELIEYSVHVNAKDKYGQTALHFAASFGHLEIVKYLLEHKANVHAVTVAGQTPLMKAVYNTTSLHGDDVIILLLKYKAKPNAQADDGRTALHIAIEHDNMAAVRILLSTPGIDINIATKDGRTPIHMAAYSGSTIMLETLVMAGADVDAKTKKGETIYDIQPHNETLRLPPAALKQRAEEAVKRGRQQAADEKKRTLMNAELEQKSKINMSKHITLTYDEEQKQLEEMTASRRNQFYQKMSQVQREKGDKHIFHYDYSNPDSIDLSKPEPEKEPIMIDTPVVNEIIPTSVKQAEKPIVIPHHVPILEQKSQHLDLSHDVTRIPAPSEHPHHTAGVHYVHGEYKPTSKPTTPNSTTRTISTLSTTTPAPASATTTATIITSQAYSIKINNNNNPAYATTTTPQVTSIITGSEKKIYTINLGGKK